VRRTTGQPHLSAVVQARRFSLFGLTARTPDETDAKKIITASSWRTGGDHQEALVLHWWRLSSRTWNLINSPRMKQLTWVRIIHSGDWCLRLVLHTPSGSINRRLQKFRQTCTAYNSVTPFWSMVKHLPDKLQPSRCPVWSQRGVILSTRCYT